MHDHPTLAAGNEIPSLPLPPSPVSIHSLHPLSPESPPTTMFRRRMDIFDLSPLYPFTCPIETLGFSVYPEEYLPPRFFYPRYGLFDLRGFPPDAFVDTVTDPIPIHRTPSSSHYRRMRHRSGSGSYVLSKLSDLELELDRAVKASFEEGDRRHRWTSEIRSPRKGGGDRKYKWTAEMTGSKYSKLTADIKGRHSDVWTVEKTGDCSRSAGKEPKKGVYVSARCTEDPGAATSVTQASRKKSRAKGKAKRKELKPEEAAVVIQKAYRNYVVRRSQSLRAIRELAMAKEKVRELRALSHNFLFRRCLALDAEQRQMFAERIISLLLTVDSIEGVDVMVRAARRLMVDELEAMLDVTDPQTPRTIGSAGRRRTFDLPDEGGIQNEIAAGVAEVVQMQDQEDKYGSDSFETCL